MHERISIHQVCFPGSSTATFARDCRAIGVQRVSLISPSLLAEGGYAEAKAALAETGLEVESVNHPFGIHSNLEMDTGQAAETLLQVIEMSAALGARSVYLLTGGRGALDWDQAADRFANMVAPCLAAAREKGVSLLIENASSLYADIHLAHSLPDTIALAGRAGLGVCIELFFCWADADIEKRIAQAMPNCRLVQVSDYVLGDRSLPARAVPGDGAIPLEALLGTILKAGYQGRFDLELIGPRIDAEGHLAAVTRAAHYLSDMLVKLEA